MSYIFVLNKYGLVEDTKYKEDFSNLPKKGENVNVYYGYEAPYFGNIGELSLENKTAVVSGVLHTQEELLEKTMIEYKNVLNMIANSELEDLTIEDREGQSELRLFEDLLFCVTNVKFIYNREEFVMENFKESLNTLILYLQAISQIDLFRKITFKESDETQLNKNRNLLYAVKAISYALTFDIISENGIPDNEESDLEDDEYNEKYFKENNRHHYMIRSIGLLHRSSDCFYKSNVDYFGEEK